MPSSSPSASEQHQRITLLLTEIIDLLTRELSILAHSRWEELPSLKREKVVLADRLKRVDWSPDPAIEVAAIWNSLKSQIACLEAECRQKIGTQMELMSKQILALQELHQYWRECLSISFGNLAEAVPAA